MIFDFCLVTSGRKGISPQCSGPRVHFRWSLVQPCRPQGFVLKCGYRVLLHLQNTGVLWIRLAWLTWIGMQKQRVGFGLTHTPPLWARSLMLFNNLRSSFWIYKWRECIGNGVMSNELNYRACCILQSLAVCLSEPRAITGALFSFFGSYMLTGVKVLVYATLKSMQSSLRSLRCRPSIRGVEPCCFLLRSSMRYWWILLYYF